MCVILNQLNKNNKLGKIWDFTLIVPKFFGKKAFINDLFGESIGPVFGIFRELELTNEYQDFNLFKNWFLINWKNKDLLLNNYKNFIYQKINNDSYNFTHLLKIIIHSFLFTLLLSNNFGRYYLMIVFVVSYIFIIFKL